MKGDDHGPDVKDVPIGEPDGCGDALAPAQGAVLAAEVLEHGAFLRHVEFRMPAGHRRCVEPDFHVGIASDDMLAY
jgi:hypothetical protein